MYGPWKSGITKRAQYKNFVFYYYHHIIIFTISLLPVLTILEISLNSAKIALESQEIIASVRSLKLPSSLHWLLGLLSCI